jgi:hypothetical protein
MVVGAYLCFLKLEEYLAHLEERGLKLTRLELVCEISTQDASRGVALYHAVASAILSDHIAYCKIFLERAVTCLHEQESIHEEIQWPKASKARKQIADLRVDLETKGWLIKGGRWSMETPGCLAN